MRWIALLVAVVVALGVGARVGSGALGPNLPTCPDARPIVIDPGHGGIDGGANVPTMLEKDIVLDVAIRVQKHLEAYSVPVVMTRESDVDLGGRNDGWRLRRDLNYRVRVANHCRAAFMLSVHVNSASTTRERGMMMFYQPGRASRDAAVMLDRALRAGGLNSRQERPHPRSDFAVLKYTKAPALLLELGFVTSPEDRAKLGDAAYREQVARMLATGMVTIYQNWMKDGNL